MFTIVCITFTLIPDFSYSDYNIVWYRKQKIQIAMQWYLKKKNSCLNVNNIFEYRLAKYLKVYQSFIQENICFVSLSGNNSILIYILICFILYFFAFTSFKNIQILYHVFYASFIAGGWIKASAAHLKVGYDQNTFVRPVSSRPTNVIFS